MEKGYSKKKVRLALISIEINQRPSSILKIILLKIWHSNLGKGFRKLYTKRKINIEIVFESLEASAYFR